MGMSVRVLRALKPHLRRFDVEVSRWSKSYEFQRVRYMRDLGVAALVDVGANEGQYGAKIRAQGFPGRLPSIKPQAQAMFFASRLWSWSWPPMRWRTE